MKSCNKCNIEKNLTEFGKHKIMKDGLTNTCKSCNKEINKKYRQENKEYYKEYQKKYSKENKEKLKKQKKQYQKKRRETDPLFRMAHNLRVRTYKSFINKGYRKTSKTHEMLDADYETVKQHIENQFTDGMNWNNYGEWQIDHIQPLAKASDLEELIERCRYTNLQPLWAEDNLKKSDKENWMNNLK